MFKRFFLTLLFLALLGVAGGAGAVPAQAQAVPIAYVNTPLLNVRAGPGANHAIATQVDYGQDLVLLGRNFDSTWVQVSVPKAGTGWVNARYLLTTVGLAGLPVADGSTGQAKAYSISGLNLRAGPGYAFAILTTVPRHSDLVVLAQNLSGGWAQVRRPDGQEGWADARYLKLSTALNGLPVADRQYPAPGGTPVPTPLPPAGFAYWRGEYYANRDLAGQPALVRDDPALDFAWWGNPALPGLPADDFSVRWTRQLPFDAGTYRFRLTADDGVRLWVGDRLLIDDWREGQKTRTADLNLAAGPQVVRLEYFERGGDALARLTWERVDAYPDWRADYWNNTALSGAPIISRNDGALDFIWGQAAPDPRLPADNFSARWTRSVNVEAGTYRFKILVDDGARLWVDDRLLIDEWRGGAVREAAAEISLAAGAHTVKLEYYEATLDARVRLTWERLGAQSFPD
ncbi:MAG: SH3 domain-containing protein, partial [Anaerolineales bacterium]|nr:SH3 domain-containing protein [Anaerolineales bacterium]